MPTRPVAPDSSASEKRDLRTGLPLWVARAGPEIACAPPLAPSKVDVVVVGAGMTGSLIALAAASKGLSTIVLDRRPPARGSTAASTALLQWEVDTPLIHLAEQIGYEPACRAFQRCFRALGDFGVLVGRHDLRCGFRPQRALYLSGNTLDARQLAEEGRQRRAAGLPSTLLSKQELHDLTGIAGDAALLSEGAADVDPVAFTQSVLLEAQRAGARLLSPVELAEVVPGSTKVAMATSDGVELEAKALVFATGYELAHGVPSEGHRLTSTWAFATPPQPQAIWGRGELIWEAAEPYLYARTTTDGRVVVGGEDEDFDDEDRRDALIPAKIRALQEKTKRLFPWLDVTADFAWAGTFGESETGLPAIGPVPGMPNCHAVLGYGGNGFTFGMIAAQIIGASLVGQADRDADLFAFKA